MGQKYSLDDIYKLLKKAEEYELLEKQGRLIHLPCPLESMVYRVVPDCDKCTVVKDIKKCNRKLKYNCVKKVMPCIFTPDLIMEYGKTVFSTETEAVVASVS